LPRGVYGQLREVAGETRRHARAPVRRWRPLVAMLGPGVVAGVSDADPTTVGTLAVVGSITQYSLLWLTLLLLPMLAAVQMIASRVGIVTGRDLQRAVVVRFGRRAQVLALISVVAVNIFTIAADLAAGGAALQLLTGVDWRWMVPSVAVVVLGLLLAGGFDEVQRVLQYIILVLLCFPVAAILARPQWGLVLHDSVVPTMSLRRESVTAALALLGTSLTSYVYVWQSIERVEERPTLAQLRSKAVQSAIGIVVAIGVFWFIHLSAAATVGRRGIRVETAEQAAQALRPVAGSLATYLFAIGLLASTLISVPILAVVTAYVVGAEFDWRRGLSQPVGGARRFYLVLSASLALGVASILVGIDPIRLLFWSSIAGGIGTPISLAFLVVIARDRELMGNERIGAWLTSIGWGIVAVVTAVSAFFIVQHLGG
jgi:Mn2+/Fe2+ NRAMP family transporter